MRSQPSLIIPVAIAGAALLASGVLRLTGRALHRMPAAVAVALLAAGAAVGALGFALPPSEPSPSSAPATTQATQPSGLRATTQAPSSAPVPAVAEVAGSVTRPDGTAVGGATAVLHRFERTELVETRSAVTGPDGGFAFGDLPAGPADGYRITADHEGTTFGTDLLLPDAHTRTLRADLVVAPSTSDPSSLRVDVDSMVLAGDGSAVQVLHVVKLENPTDRAYAGGVRLPLLARASGLDPRVGLDRTRIGVVSGDLVSSAPVLPGSTEIQYLYGVRMGAEGLDVRRTFRHPTRSFTLLVAEGLSAVSSGLREPERVELAGRTYASLRSDGPLEPGDTLRATVSVPRTVPRTVRTAIVVAGVVAALAAIGVPLARRRRPDEPAPIEHHAAGAAG